MNFDYSILTRVVLSQCWWENSIFRLAYPFDRFQIIQTKFPVILEQNPWNVIRASRGLKFLWELAFVFIIGASVEGSPLSYEPTNYFHSEIEVSTIAESILPILFPRLLLLRTPQGIHLQVSQFLRYLWLNKVWVTEFIFGVLILLSLPWYSTTPISRLPSCGARRV